MDESQLVGVKQVSKATGLSRQQIGYFCRNSTIPGMIKTTGQRGGPGRGYRFDGSNKRFQNWVKSKTRDASEPKSSAGRRPKSDFLKIEEILKDQNHHIYHAERAGDVIYSLQVYWRTVARKLKRFNCDLTPENRGKLWELLCKIQETHNLACAGQIPKKVHDREMKRRSNIARAISKTVESAN